VLRTLLTTIGIVLGVALFVAMQTANQGVLAAFSETIDRVAGKTDLQITAGENGFGEEALEQVQSSGVVSVAVPVIEAVVDTDRHGTLLILGVDMTGDRSLRAYDTEGPEDSAIDDPLIFLAQADSLLVSKKFADRSGLHVDSRLSLGTAEGDKDFVVRGVMRSSHLADAYGGNLAVMDIYAAQKMFGRGRTFDRIDLALKPTIGLEEGRRLGHLRRGQLARRIADDSALPPFVAAIFIWADWPECCCGTRADEDLAGKADLNFTGPSAGSPAALCRETPPQSAGERPATAAAAGSWGASPDSRGYRTRPLGRICRRRS